METQNHLGIYLGKETATVVCLGSQGRGRKVLDCFSVSVEQGQQAEQTGGGIVGLVNLIAEACAKKGPMYQNCEAAVALDCAMFMQHNVHTGFNDPKQIAATIRFDTEEALAMDISDVVLAFKTTSSSQTGSELTVFTAQKEILSEIILSLQSNNIDPVSVEPDVNCLSRFIRQNVPGPQSQEGATIFAMLSARNGYFIASPTSRKQSSPEPIGMRTLLLGSTQDREQLLTREVAVTAALAGSREPVNYLKVSDSAGSVDVRQVGERLGIETASVDLAQCADTDPQDLTDCADHVDFAIAYGAALSDLERQQGINFRSDFMPYEGRKIRLQKALKFLSISVMVLVFAAGLHLQLQLLQRNKPRGRLREKFGQQYSAVTLGKKLPDKPVNELKGIKRRIESVKKGLLSVTGEESVSAKLTLVLRAFNKCASQTGLNIDSISVTTKMIRIVGSTSSRKNTLKLRRAVEDSELKILQDHLVLEGGRDTFGMTVVPKE